MIMKKDTEKTKPDRDKVLTSLYEVLAHQMGVKLESIKITDGTDKESA